MTQMTTTSPRQSPRLLMTGGTGPLGATLLQQILDSGWAVTLIGRTSPTLRHPQLAWTRQDLRQGLALEESGARFDAILHMANLSKQDPDADLAAATALARAAVTRGIPHFFYASTIRVYGASFGVVDEDTPPRPVAGDRYARGKLRVERGLREILAEDDGPRLRILRVGHVVSDGNAEELSRGLSLPYLLLWGRTNPHFIHAKDAADAIAFLLASRDRLRHGIYNVTREIGVAHDYNHYYGSAISKALALPRLLAHVVALRRPEGKTTRTADIRERNLTDESWRFEQRPGDPLLSPDWRVIP